ncbi:hypothetical protein GCM10023353_20230 [Tomitella cavernea]|uniref:Uncharacterized protein n=1 Tax=Tomitella cavernea TaxID=1387982 RepID=A0ABP9CP09_9ACTN
MPYEQHGRVQQSASTVHRCERSIIEPAVVPEHKEHPGTLAPTVMLDESPELVAPGSAVSARGIASMVMPGIVGNPYGRTSPC